MKNNSETLRAKRGSRKAIMAAGSLAQLALAHQAGSARHLTAVSQPGERSAILISPCFRRATNCRASLYALINLSGLALPLAKMIKTSDQSFRALIIILRFKLIFNVIYTYLKCSNDKIKHLKHTIISILQIKNLFNYIYLLL